MFPDPTGTGKAAHPLALNENHSAARYGARAISVSPNDSMLAAHKTEIERHLPPI